MRTGTPPHPGAIVLFDGTCAFCEGSVKFIARRDRARYFRFGASQSPKAAALLASYGFTREMTRSLVLIEDGRVFLRSTASLRIAGRLSFPWKLARIFLILPLPIRDGAYRIVAAIRHRVAGSSNACDVPPPEIRARMI
jgi:predicted DCC family thiol-disulfide oxidoreductase YuxK